MSNDIDEIILEYLQQDIEFLEAEEELPAPPRVPLFAAETVRPGKA